MTTVPMNSANRFAHIDAMRAYAVMVVVVAHAGLGMILPGGSGVTIFFSISGFIITYLLLRERDKTGGFSVRGFYRRRFYKIFPPLIVAIVIPSLVWAVSNPIDWRAFFAQILFVFNWFKIDQIPLVLPGSGVVWSLSIEEQFYIVFALVWLAIVRTRHWLRITLITAIFVAAWSTTARILLAGDPSRVYYGTDTRLDGIAYGVIAAVAFYTWQTRGEPANLVVRIFSSNWALWAAVAMYLVTLLIRDEWFRSTFRFSIQSIAACVVIVYGLLPGTGLSRTLLHRISTWRPVETIGLASYSIYLVHLVISGLLAPLFIGLPQPVALIAQVIAGCAAGITMYYWVEVPSHRLRIRLETSNRSRQ